jgi:hypothetical protein
MKDGGFEWWLHQFVAPVAIREKETKEWGNCERAG